MSVELTFVQVCTPVASWVFSQPLPVREGGREGVAALALGGGVVLVGVEEPDTDGSPKRPGPSKGGMAGLKGVFLPLGGTTV